MISYVLALYRLYVTKRLLMKGLLIGVLLVCGCQLFGQQLDSVPAAPQEKVRMVFMDSVRMERKNRLPVPKKALLYSFALPGSGQVYNGHWWKAPFAVGAIGTMVYFVTYNTDLYKRFQSALENELLKKPHEFTQYNLGVTGLRNRRDFYDKNRQLSYVGVFAAYGLVAVEAFVDAHLQNFDMSEDLSFKIKPTFQSDPRTGFGGPGIGIVVFVK